MEQATLIAKLASRSEIVVRELPDDPDSRIVVEAGEPVYSVYDFLRKTGIEKELDEAGYECDEAAIAKANAKTYKREVRWTLTGRARQGETSVYILKNGNRRYAIVRHPWTSNDGGTTVLRVPAGMKADEVAADFEAAKKKYGVLLDRFDAQEVRMNWVDALYRATHCAPNPKKIPPLVAEQDGGRWYDFFANPGGGTIFDCGDGSYRVYDSNGDGPMKFTRAALASQAGASLEDFCGRYNLYDKL